MTLQFGTFDVMNYLWETMDKTGDGHHIRYTPEDIEVLWKMGFVDTKQFPFGIWQAAFEPYTQADGSFLLNRDAFLQLDQYRYTGDIRVPFDALKINEGQYSDEGLNELIELSIAPSCNLPSEHLIHFVATLKKEFRQENRLIRIGRDAKLRIQKLLEDHPSPLRNLELLMEKMFAQGGGEAEKIVQAHELQQSSGRGIITQPSLFTTSATSRAELYAKGLKKLTKAKAEDLPADTTQPTKELKKIRRSKRGIRG